MTLLDLEYRAKVRRVNCFYFGALCIALVVVSACHVEAAQIAEWIGGVL